MIGVAFWKLSGAGNDFVALEETAVPGGSLPAEQIVRLCDRRHGVGADGVLILGAAEYGALRVGYWNADGSPAAFCGNGARCAARLGVERGLVAAEHRLLFGVERLDARVTPGRVEIDVPRPEVLEPVRRCGEEGRGLVSWARLRAGVEHVVAEERRAGSGRYEDAARLAGVRPGTVNLTIFRRYSGEAGEVLHVRTLERGSGETLACGSAALAVAAIAAGSGSRDVQIVPPAGIPLSVSVPAAPARLTLAGEARVVFEGVIRELG